MECSCYDKINVYNKYNGSVCNTNDHLNSINSNHQNMSYYNYKIGDTKLNLFLKDIYKYKYIDFIKKYDYDDCTIDLNKYIREFELLKPHNVKEENDHYCIYFNLHNNSKIWVNIQPDNTSTLFKLIEYKQMNKNDYAYTTLLFPSYNEHGKKEYSYLLGCLLVAYLLKTQPQNYDLYLNKKVGTKATIICMITPDVEIHIIKILKQYYDVVVIVPYITFSENVCEPKIKITDISRGNINHMHPYSKVFTKLNIFNKTLFNYKKVIFIDSDLFPMGYYDSLFTLNTPSGCLEHRRYQDEDLGIGSWALDRGQFFKHGQLIPKMFTDISNIYASDINASLLVVEPNNDLFIEMIHELQQAIDDIFSDYDSTIHKGFWLGNKFYNFYYLPEQNYLTQKLSGQWHSIDMGFSTWLIDIEQSFGFTFAGFIVKPWSYQSKFHTYSINPYSLFSKINNQYTNRSYGYQIFNHYLVKMIYNSKLKTELIEFLKILKITDFPFDTWENEVILSNQKYIYDYDYHHLSFDQKKIYYLITNNHHVIKYIYFDYLFESICQHIYNIDYIAISYHIMSIINDIFDELHLLNKIYPFGNTLTALHHYNSFDITDDDNDLIIIVKKDKYKDKILNLIKKLLDNKFQIYYRTKKLNEFVQIVSHIKPSYYFINENKKCITLDDFNKKFDNLNFSFFNISLYKSQLDSLCNDLNIIKTNDLFISSNKCVYQKSPWIDIFFIINVYDKLTFNLKSDFNPEYYLFTNKYKNMNVNNCLYNIISYKDYIQEFYKSDENYYNYKIKSKHNYLNSDKNILFKIPINNKIEKKILLFLYDEINNQIKKIYNSFCLKKYMY
jgi:hypothetical protein